MSHPLDGFPDRIRLPLAFDPAALAAELAAFEERLNAPFRARQL